MRSKKCCATVSTITSRCDRSSLIACGADATAAMAGIDDTLVGLEMAFRIRFAALNLS